MTVNYVLRFKQVTVKAKKAKKSNLKNLEKKATMPGFEPSTVRRNALNILDELIFLENVLNF